jgi:hypothetical protein
MPRESRSEAAEKLAFQRPAVNFVLRAAAVRKLLPAALQRN